MVTNRKYIDNFVNNNGPDGIGKLARKCKVSSSLLEKVRCGYVPKKKWVRLQIAHGLHLPEIKLFPSLKGGEL